MLVSEALFIFDIESNKKMGEKGVWTQKHAEMNGLCLSILNFLYKNPDIATRVIITTDKIISEIKRQPDEYRIGYGRR